MKRKQTLSSVRVGGQDVALPPRIEGGIRRDQRANDDENVGKCHFCRLDYKDADPELGPWFLDLACPTCSATLTMEHAAKIMRSLTVAEMMIDLLRIRLGLSTKAVEDIRATCERRVPKDDPHQHGPGRGA